MNNNRTRLDNNITEIVITRTRRTRPPGFENMTLDQLHERNTLLSQIITDRVGHTVEVEENLITPSEQRQEINNVVENLTSAQETISEVETTTFRVHGRVDGIINPTNFAEWLISLVHRLNDIPIFSKLVLASGLTLLIISGGYIAYRIINREPRITPPTFGSRTFGSQMTTFGRIMRAIIYKD